MSNLTANYYGFEGEIQLVNHGPVMVEKALEIVSERFVKLKDKYEMPEEAIADTMFGFDRGKTTFIEICINGRNKISFKFEYPQPKKLGIFSSVYKKEWTLPAKEDLEERVKKFFTLPTEEYRAYLESKA